MARRERSPGAWNWLKSWGFRAGAVFACPVGAATVREGPRRPYFGPAGPTVRVRVEVLATVKSTHGISTT